VLSQKLRYKYAYDDMLLGMTIPEPSITFSDRMCLQMGDVTFYLVYFGRAHTESDILIYVPEEKTLFTGDLFSHGGKSWIGDSENADVERWKNVIDSIMINNNQIKVIISGHGEVMSGSDLESFRSFVNEQWEKVKGI